MYAFTLERPASLPEAVSLAAAGAKPLAGGQTMLASMKLRLSAPRQLADLAGLSELTGIHRGRDHLVVGAMSRHAEVAANEEVRAAYPALASLASRIGDRQVRAMGTIGGSLANNDPAACYPSAVLASGATVTTQSREITADDFFQGLFSTALAEGELIKSIRFPIPRRAAYEKLRQQASHFPLVGVFVAQFDGGVRVAITGGGNGVFRHPALEASLSRSFTPEAARSVRIDSADFQGDLHASAAFRAHLAGVLAARAVAKA